MPSVYLTAFVVCLASAFGRSTAARESGAGQAQLAMSLGHARWLTEPAGLPEGESTWGEVLTALSRRTMVVASVEDRAAVGHLGARMTWGEALSAACRRSALWAEWQEDILVISADCSALLPYAPQHCETLTYHAFHCLSFAAMLSTSQHAQLCQGGLTLSSLSIAQQQSLQKVVGCLPTVPERRWRHWISQPGSRLFMAELRFVPTVTVLGADEDVSFEARRYEQVAWRDIAECFDEQGRPKGVVLAGEVEGPGGPAAAPTGDPAEADQQGDAHSVLEALFAPPLSNQERVTWPRTGDTTLSEVVGCVSSQCVVDRRMRERPVWLAAGEYEKGELLCALLHATCTVVREVESQTAVVPFAEQLLPANPRDTQRRLAAYRRFLRPLLTDADKDLRREGVPFTVQQFMDVTEVPLRALPEQAQFFVADRYLYATKVRRMAQGEYSMSLQRAREEVTRRRAELVQTDARVRLSPKFECALVAYDPRGDAQPSRERTQHYSCAYEAKLSF